MLVSFSSLPVDWMSSIKYLKVKTYSTSWILSFICLTSQNALFFFLVYTLQLFICFIILHNSNAILFYQKAQWKDHVKASTPYNVIYLHYPVCLKHFAWEQSVIKSTSIHPILELCHSFEFRMLSLRKER